MASDEGKLMTHDEIWDDSALVDSWNEALEEYKRYHSIHRHGGNVDDLRRSKPEQNGSDAKGSTDEIDSLLDPGVDTADTEMRGEAKEAPVVDGRPEGGTSTTQHSHPHGLGPGPVPAGLLGSVRDEGLKRLLMSWYYAGYYTGYYEGQRDSPSQKDDSKH
ncbi:hypothetical protein F4809DRAFT_555766 [Biscogniauxia mediterranea]|nr:hypothetical protein F5X96DRAFT_647800 [Biscogniauxia mediterranea]KAI1633948.1 hypothetical protein F4809DRAFT_555766 [Biscogniauxia mediterranea]